MSKNLAASGDKNNITFSIIGGDKRNIALAEMLFRRGHTVKAFGFANSGTELSFQCRHLSEALKDTKFVIGPTPCALSGGILNAPFHGESLYLEDLFRKLSPEQVFISGYVKPRVFKLARECNVQLIDMLAREELLVLNAIPTAEGAIKIAIEETDITLHGSRVMVIGYGRIGKVLCRMLAGMGANVTAVVDTGEARANVVSAGHESVYYTDIDDYLSKNDIIFNTVPKILLNERNLIFVKTSALIIDLASPPGGVELEASHRLGLKTLFASSLPGKVAPVTAAEYILATINRIVAEVEDNAD